MKQPRPSGSHVIGAAALEVLFAEARRARPTARAVALMQRIGDLEVAILKGLADAAEIAEYVALAAALHAWRQVAWAAARPPGQF
ncbi:hypothetical protein AB0F17_62380 [Nonomuraea sp. NPDC026600]|uniref:hypothetical protein n=1 Tax=Nonomuraea sp. NPDC026600 TaxID=3155363 RepID=UPI0033DC5552